MKNLMYVAALALVTQCYAEINTEKIEEAIEQSSLSRVKALLGRADLEEMTVKARKKLYRDFYDLAVETTENRTQNVSMVGNWRDMLKTGSGVAALLLSGFAGLFSLDTDDQGRFTGFDRRWLFGSVGLGVTSVYLLYKGITCSAQKAEVAVAKSIEKYIKSKLNNSPANDELDDNEEGK